MKIELVPIDSLVFDPANARKHNQKNIDAIKGSLARFKQQKPIVVNKDNVVIAGNGTLQAAKELGWQKISVIRTELAGTDLTAFGLADNRSSELAEWDVGNLGDLLKSLQDMEFDVGEIGFDAKDLETLLPDREPEQGLTDDDAVPENVETRCKPGDLWILGNHRLLCGDSTNVLHVDLLMNGEKADMVFTDPPYGINAVAREDGRVGGRSERAKPGKYKPVIGDDSEFDAAFLLNLSDNVFIFGGNYFAHQLPRSTHWLVWNKHTNTDIERKFDSSDCELIWTNSKRTNVSQYTFGWSGMFRSGSKKDEMTTRVHPTQKPVGLLAEILKTYSHNSILDLFLGSGSTLIACEKTGRKCYGCEIDPHYVSVAIERWMKFTGKEAYRLEVDGSKKPYSQCE